MILINGCSHTHGTILLQRRNEKPWSYHLSKLCNKKVVNIAESGSNWHSIVISTIEWVEKNDEKPEMIICAFPEFTRLSMPANQRSKVDFSFRTNTKDYSIFPNNDGGTKQPESVRDYFYNTSPYHYIWLFEQCIHSINYLKLFCELKGIVLKTFYWSQKPDTNYIANHFDYNLLIEKIAKDRDIDFIELEKYYDDMYDLGILTSKLKKLDIFPDMHIFLRHFGIYNGHIGMCENNNGFIDTHHDGEGHKFIAKLIFDAIFNNKIFDCEMDDVEFLKEQIKKKPQFKEHMMYDVAQDFIEHGVKKTTVMRIPDEIFIYP